MSSAPGSSTVDGARQIGDAPSGWREHAGFIVSFDHRRDDDGEAWQTRVWDTKAMVEMTVPGTAPGRWIDFVLERADPPGFR